MRASESSHVEKSDWVRERDMSLVAKLRSGAGTVTYCTAPFPSPGVWLVSSRPKRSHCTVPPTTRIEPSPDERCTPSWPPCLQGPHALPPPHDTKVRPASALPTSESSSFPDVCSQSINSIFATVVCCVDVPRHALACASGPHEPFDPTKR
jgi:hypothetical protein